jgi:hypothetical protein
MCTNRHADCCSWHQTTFDDLAADAHDEVGIVRSRDYLTDLIKKETESTGIPTSRMILGSIPLLDNCQRNHC